jgi:hypothetical protein
MGYALLTAPKTTARARENFDISALPEDALNEINRIQTRQRLDEVVKRRSWFHRTKELNDGSQTRTGALHAHGRRTNT